MKMEEEEGEKEELDAEGNNRVGNKNKRKIKGWEKMMMEEYNKERKREDGG